MQREAHCGVTETGRTKRAQALLEQLQHSATCSIEEAATLLCIGRSTAYAAARDGSLPTVRLSKRLLVPTAKLLAMLGLETDAGGE
jgi:excisionase family DNA binding protein